MRSTPSFWERGEEKKKKGRVEISTALHICCLPESFSPELFRRSLVSLSMRTHLQLSYENQTLLQAPVSPLSRLLVLLLSLRPVRSCGSREVVDCQLMIRSTSRYESWRRSFLTHLRVGRREEETIPLERPSLPPTKVESCSQGILRTCRYADC